MSFVYSYSRTMAGARAIVVDEGLTIAPPAKSKRERIIEMSRRWNEARGKVVPIRPAPLPLPDPVEIEQREMEAERQANLAELHRTPVERRASVKEVITRVAAWHDLSYAEIIADGRFRHIVVARRDAVVAVWLNCRIEGKPPTLASLSRAFNKDHTGILNILRKVGLR